MFHGQLPIRLFQFTLCYAIRSSHFNHLPSKSNQWRSEGNLRPGVKRIKVEYWRNSAKESKAKHLLFLLL